MLVLLATIVNPLPEKQHSGHLIVYAFYLERFLCHLFKCNYFTKTRFEFDAIINSEQRCSGGKLNNLLRYKLSTYTCIKVIFYIHRCTESSKVFVKVDIFKKNT